MDEQIAPSGKKEGDGNAQEGVERWLSIEQVKKDRKRKAVNLASFSLVSR